MAKQAMSGVISGTSTKPWLDRRTNQNITLYSFQVEGSNRWFRTGTDPIPFGKGQAVEFVVDGQNVDVKTMKSSTRAVQLAPSVEASSPTKGQTASGSATGAGSRDEYWANKEARDLEKEKRFQEVNEPRMALSVATEAAAAVVVAALQNDALSFGNTAKSKRQGQLTNFVKEIATELALFINDAPNVLKEAKEMENLMEGASSEGVGEVDDE